MPTSKALSNPKGKGKSNSKRHSPPPVKKQGGRPRNSRNWIPAEKLSAIRLIAENPPQEVDGGWDALAEMHNKSGEYHRSAKAFKKQMTGDLIRKKKKTGDPNPEESDPIHSLALKVRAYLDTRVGAGVVDDSADVKLQFMELDDEFAAVEMEVLGAPVGSRTNQVDENGAGPSGHYDSELDEPQGMDGGTEDDDDGDDDGAEAGPKDEAGNEGEAEAEGGEEDGNGDGNGLEPGNNASDTGNGTDADTGATSRRRLRSSSWDFEELPPPLVSQPHANLPFKSITRQPVHSAPLGNTTTHQSLSAETSGTAPTPFPLSKAGGKPSTSSTTAAGTKVKPMQRPKMRPRLVPSKPIESKPSNDNDDSDNDSDVVVIASRESTPVVLWDDVPSKSRKRQLVPDIKKEPNQAKRLKSGEDKTPSKAAGSSKTTSSSKGQRTTMKVFKADAQRDAEQFKLLNANLDPKHAKAAAEQRQADALGNLTILSRDARIESLENQLAEARKENMELQMRIVKLEADARIEAEVKKRLDEMSAARNLALPPTPQNVMAHPANHLVWQPPAPVNLAVQMPNLDEAQQGFPAGPSFDPVHPFSRQNLE